MLKQLVQPRGSTFRLGREGSWQLLCQAGKSLEGKQQLLESQMGIGVLLDMLIQLQRLLSIPRRRQSRPGKLHLEQPCLCFGSGNQQDMPDKQRRRWHPLQAELYQQHKR